MDTTPKYQYVFETLRNDILAGKFTDNDRFPSEGQLMLRFKVSRNTVRTALEDLKRSGMIETRNGSGTFLSPAARKATGTIGLIMPVTSSAEIFPPIFSEISHLARQEGYSTVLGDASSPDPLIRSTQALRLAHDYANAQTVGVILKPLELTPDYENTTAQIVSVLDAKGIPVVLIDCDTVKPPQRSKFDLVGIDNVRAGQLLAEHLIARGARKIHVLVRPGSAPTVFKRTQGVQNALLDAGLSWKKTNLHVFDPENISLVRKAFSRNVDAVVCGNDDTAARLLDSLRKLKIRVPQDLLVTGVDDVRYAMLVSPQLTTLHQPCEQIAAAAFQLLTERIRNPSLPAREILVDARLVVRASTTLPSSVKRPARQHSAKRCR